MPRKISIKGLQRKLEHLQRDYLIKKRGGKCEMCASKENLIADHCFSRKVRQLFLDERNITILCNDICHFKKMYRINNMDARVLWHVRKREGERAFEEMWDIAGSHKPFPNWSKRWWLNEKLKELRK